MHDPVFDIFAEEAKEHLGALEKGFLDLESASEPKARRGQIDSLFRHAHSLKGDARAIGLPALQEASQRLEDILDGLRKDPEQVNRAVIDRGLNEFDVIRKAFETWQRSLMEAKADQGKPNPSSPGGDEHELSAGGPALTPDPSPRGRGEEGPPSLTQRASPGGGEEEQGVPVALPSPSTQEDSFTVRVPSERLDRMLNLAGELRIVQRSGEDLHHRLADLHRFLAYIFDCCRTLEQLVGLESSAHPRESEYLIPGLEQIANLKAQLEGCQDQVRRVVNAARTRSGREETLLETLEADIQQARLLPLTMLADSLRRAVRDLSQSLGKPMRYEVDVGSVLVDKAILEALRDPMLHLVRNAASHGIEPGEERRRAGKPAEGVIRIQATRRGSSVRILVSDDGRGVDFDGIRARVRQTEGLPEAEVAALSREKLARYLFKPGFTTAVSRDAISGRGVGLDVVLNTVHRLHGNVVLEATSPQGTTFAITVPVSISTIRILTVLCDGQYYGIPSTRIEKTGRVKVAELRELEGCPILPLNGEPVRWFPLNNLLRSSSQAAASNPYGFYVLMKQQGRQVAVAVDDMEEEGEVLLKPLGFPLRDFPGVLGAAIRPDGSVQIVLDLPSAALESAGAALAKPQEVKRSARLLLVDDSPTTRTILRNVFTAAGYVVKTAMDGVDALERLRVEPVDLVVSDVEMPRMDGFELTRQVKAKHRLPVILVTGLEKEDARRKGLEAGADAYVVKSTFQGGSLLEIVKQLV